MARSRQKPQRAKLPQTVACEYSQCETSEAFACHRELAFDYSTARARKARSALLWGEVDLQDDVLRGHVRWRHFVQRDHVR